VNNKPYTSLQPKADPPRAETAHVTQTRYYYI